MGAHRLEKGPQLIERRGAGHTLPVPAKQTLYAEGVGDYTRSFIATPVARPRAEGVEAVELATPFQTAGQKCLYFAYDTHWNARRADLVAGVMARELFWK